MLPLPRASKLADKLVAHMACYCLQVAVAGSIRRGRAEVSDIDLVILPKPEGADAIRALLQPRWDVVVDGPQNSIFRRDLIDHTPVQLDIFWARPSTHDLFASTPSNWGTLLICRTGSKEHNIFLVEHAKTMGLIWSPNRGVMDDQTILAAETEEAVFSALQLPFIDPKARER